jgi:hypothetical protein
VGTRIDVRPDAFYEAAQSLDGTVLAAADGALDQLCATLGSCGAMAGSDPGGVAWADQYDRAARVAVRAGTDLSNALYRLVQLLEQTGVNHERADAASTVGGLRAATRDGAYLHGAYEFTHPAPPSASGGSSSPPTGWSLVESAVGYVWPNGHQDRLNAAGDAWAAAAASYDSAADAMFPVWAEIAVQRSPEVDDACVICDDAADHLRRLAHAFGSLAQACHTLAGHIDTVHSQVEHELVSIGVQSAAIEGFGAIARLRTLRIVAVEVEGVPGFRTVVITSRAARGGQAITTTEMAGEIRATEGLVNSDRLGSINPKLVGRTKDDPGLWNDHATLGDHFRRHGRAFGAQTESEYAKQATNFFERALTEGLPTKIDSVGTIRIYDPSTGAFGAYSPTGDTYTFFKASAKYWGNQRGELQ